MTILTKENAKYAKLIRNINHPEWGTKEFNYNAQPLTDNTFASTFGRGFNSSVLFEEEFHLWEVLRWNGTKKLKHCKS